jgi:archaeal chaperonin
MEQPIYIMPEDSRRTTGRNAQINNIAAAKAVAQTVRTTLGPKGMDKMLVDSTGNTIVSNDGVTILEEMDIEHPAAKMVVEIAKTQENMIGDGTTTAVVLAGELLKNAEQLLEQNIHPTIIAKGYRLSEKKAQEILLSLAENVNFDQENVLKNIAITAMTGKGAETNKELLAELVVKAIKKVNLEKENIKIEKVIGENSLNSQLIEGVVIDKERVHPNMPSEINDCKIALLNCPLEIKNTEIDAKIQITSPEQLDLFLEQEERSLKEIVEKIFSVGANVIFCQKGIDDLAQHYLAKKGILAVRRVKKSDMELLAKATQGEIINNWKELTSEDLGFAGLVQEIKLNQERMIFVEKCHNPKAVTLLIHGSTEHVVEEIKRAITDALGDVAAALKEGKIVGGAGSIEILLSERLNDFANTLQGREQLAVKAFANSLEIIPKTLAENAGLDPIDVLVNLRTKSEFKWKGINVFTGEIIDSFKEGIVEPLKIKTLALSSATEVAEMILRIDDVIARSKKEQKHI